MGIHGSVHTRVEGARQFVRIASLETGTAYFTWHGAVPQSKIVFIYNLQ